MDKINWASNAVAQRLKEKLIPLFKAVKIRLILISEHLRHCQYTVSWDYYAKVYTRVTGVSQRTDSSPTPPRLPPLRVRGDHRERARAQEGLLAWLL